MRRGLVRGCGAIALALLVPTTGSGQSATSSTGQTPGAISGVVVDSATKRPVLGAIVTLGPAVLIGTGTRQLTDDRGRFIFLGLPPAANYTLEAHKSGYLDRSNLVRPRQFMLAPGQWLADQRLEIIPEASISGVVRDERGEPVVGARVRLVAFVSINGRMHPAGGPVTTSDDRGFYRFAGLPEGRYAIAVPSVQHAVPADTPAAVVGGRSMAQVATSGAAATARGVEQAALDLDPGHRLLIGGYVTPPPPASGQPQVYPITFHPSARTLSESSAVALRAGQQREGVDLQLRPVPTWRVSGRAGGVSGTAAGLPLRLVLAGDEDLGLGSEAATTLVDARGNFTFLNVPAGRYIIDLRPSLGAYEFSPRNLLADRGDALPSPPGFGTLAGSTGAGRLEGAPLGTGYSFASGAWDPTVWARTEIEIADHDVVDVVVQLQRPVRVSGRLELDRQSSASRPLPSAPVTPGAPVSLQEGMRRTIVSVIPADGSLRLGALTSSVTSENTFAVDGLLAGEYVLRVRGPVGAGISVKSIVWRGADYTHAPFDTSGVTDISDVVITLTDQTQSVAGMVSGVPPGRSAAVIAFPVDPKRWANYGLQPVLIRSVDATAAGRYQLTLPAGDFFLVAVDGSLGRAWSDRGFLESAARVATRVSLSWSEVRTQDLRLVEVVR